MGRWAIETMSKRLRLPAPSDVANQSTTGDSGCPSVTGQAASRPECHRGIVPPGCTWACAHALMLECGLTWYGISKSTLERAEVPDRPIECVRWQPR
jgi:hypothetical protein